MIQMAIVHALKKIIYAEKPLHQYIISLFCIAFFLLAISLTLISNASTNNVIKQSLTDMAVGIIVQVRDNIDIAIMTKSTWLAAATLDAAYLLPDVAYINVRDAENNLIFSRKNKKQFSNHLITNSYVTEFTEKHSDDYIHIISDHNYIYISTRVYYKTASDTDDVFSGSDLDNNTLVGYVNVTLSKQRMVDSQSQLIKLLGIGSALYMIFIVIAIRFLVPVFLKPLIELANIMSSARSSLTTVSSYSDNSTIKEITTIGHAYNELLISIRDRDKKIKKNTAELEAEVQLRTKKYSKLNEENRRLIKTTHQRLENERALISRELHDELNANLITMKLHTSHIKNLAKKNRNIDSESILVSTSTLEELISRTYESGRAIIHRLRPEIIDSLGLIGALEDLINNYKNAQPYSAIQFNFLGTFENINDEKCIAVYRIIQEGLSNAIKYADAGYISIILSNPCPDNANELCLEISDDGIGFDSINVKYGIGIISIRERAHALGGQAQIESSVNNGCTIRVQIPD